VVSTARRKLIVVSNRGPVSFSRDEEGRRIVRRGGGGLVTALRSLVLHHDVTWIASAITGEDRAVAAEGGGAPLEEAAHGGVTYRLRLVQHDPAAFEAFYTIVANPTLWFLQHYLFDLPYAPALDSHFLASWRDGYLAVNEGFATAVLAELEGGPPEVTVFFHDYHLYLAPRLVRDRSPDAQLAHFVHIPWPQPDYWRILPPDVRTAIHDGLLANDLVGFHTARWKESFLLSCESVLGAGLDADSVRHRDRRTEVVARPISVDAREFEELGTDPVVLERQAEIHEGRPERLVIRVDRTDPSKNIVRGFRAFGLYLEQHPEMHGRVGMLALLDPSRQDIPEYAEYLTAIEAGARAVNEQFGRADWTPVELRIEDDFPRSVAAYKEYDVLLVNAVFDGLNLVAKEGPLANERDGVLVLSENTGAHEELGAWAVSVNPFDVQAQADAIATALEMPLAERRARGEAIREQVRRHGLEEWVAALLVDLDRVATPTRA
jgi:trehalose 6-phosphate synthase